MGGLWGLASNTAGLIYVVSAVEVTPQQPLGLQKQQTNDVSAVR